MANKIIVSHSSYGLGYVYENEINNQNIDFYYQDKKATITNRIGFDFNPFFTIPSPVAINEILNETYSISFNKISDTELTSLNKNSPIKISFKSPSTICGTVNEGYSDYKVTYNFIKHEGICTCNTKTNCKHALFLLNKANEYIKELLDDTKVNIDLKNLLDQITYSRYYSNKLIDLKIIKQFKEEIINKISPSLLEMIDKICKNDVKKSYYPIALYLSFAINKNNNAYNEFFANNINSKSNFISYLFTFANKKYYESIDKLESFKDKVLWLYFNDKYNDIFPYLDEYELDIDYLKGFLNKASVLNENESKYLTNYLISCKWFLSITSMEDVLVEKLQKKDIFRLINTYTRNFKNYFKSLPFDEQILHLDSFSDVDVDNILNNLDLSTKTLADQIKYISIFFGYAYNHSDTKCALIIDYLFNYRLSMYLLPLYYDKIYSSTEKKSFAKKYNTKFANENPSLEDFNMLCTYSYFHQFDKYDYHDYDIFLCINLKATNKLILRTKMYGCNSYAFDAEDLPFKNNIIKYILDLIIRIKKNEYLEIENKILAEIKEKDYQSKIAEFVNDTMKVSKYDISCITNSFHSKTNADLNVYFHNNNSISLKILFDGKEYVVKDIKDFIANFKNSNLMKFGKNNEFCCNINNLNNHGKKIYDFINKINFDNNDKYSYTKDIYVNEIIILEYFNNNDYIFFENKKYYIDNEEKNIQYLVDEDYSIKTIPFVNKNNSMLFDNYLVSFADDTNKASIYNLLNRNLYLFFNKFSDLKINENDAIFNSFMENVYSTNKDNITLKINYEDVKKYTSNRIDLYFDYEDNAVILKREYFTDNVRVDEDKLNYQLKSKINMINSFLTSLGFIEDKITDDGEIAYFLNADLSLLNKLANVYVSDTLKNKKILDFPKLKYHINYNNNMMDVFLEDSSFSDEELDKIIKAIRKKKSYIKLTDNVILNLNNNEARDFYDVTTDLHLDSKKLKETKTMPIYNRFKLINYKDDYPLDKYMEEVINSISSFKNKKMELPTYDYELKQYQKEAIYWLSELKKYNFSGILADDMGLGKTFEMLAFYDLDKEEEPSLVVCPKSLVFNWASEITKFINHTDYVKIYGGLEERKKIIRGILPNKRCLYITSYDSLRNDIELYKKIKFRYVILDEAQAIKTFTAKKAISTKLLNSTYRFVLTGTPIENNVLELWSIFDFLMPGFFEDISEFKSRFENEEGYKEVVAKKISMFILRRTKKETLKELPDKYERLLSTELTSDQQLVYDAHCKMAKNVLETQNNAFAVLPYLLRLRQICVDPRMFINNYTGRSAKMELLNSILDEYIPNKRKILIFSQFVEMLKLIEKDLASKNIKYFMLTGATNAEDRIKMCNEFNKEDCDTQVFLISIKAGGSGLNLIGADTVIHMDIWWNLAVENQATDRTYRIGQTKNVEVIKLMCENTIEEKVIELQNKKKDLIDSLISNDDKSITSMSKDDIKFILG